MKRRWSIILPVMALLMFGILSYVAYRKDLRYRSEVRPTRYFYWDTLRLDRTPRPEPSEKPKDPCTTQTPCVGWDPNFVHSYPNPLYTYFLLFALPAFAICALIIAGLGRLGVSHVLTFFLTMPPLLCAWYYLIGWRLDRRRHRRELRRAVPPDGRGTSQ